MSSKKTVRRSGDNVWRPNPYLGLVSTVGGLVLVGLTVWSFLDGGLSAMDWIKMSAFDVFILVALPPAVLRWRIVLDPEEVILVFFQARRLPLRDIVEVRSVVGEGLVFVCSDGSSESSQLVGNGRRSHRRAKPTRADLIARAVLCAAAEARGEKPPLDYRLAPTTGYKKLTLRSGIVAFVVGLILSD